MSAAKTCECGCGTPTTVAQKTRKSTGAVKGQPQRFVTGHKPGRKQVLAAPAYHTDGLCKCGCGQPTKLATTTDNRKGNVRGFPVRFVRGHHNYVDRAREAVPEVTEVVEPPTARVLAAMATAKFIRDSRRRRGIPSEGLRWSAAA